jgi:hypothetical protein
MDLKCIICGAEGSHESGMWGSPFYEDAAGGAYSVCLNCIEDYRDHNYNYKPSNWVFHGNKGGNYVGIELEFEGRQGNTTALIKAKEILSKEIKLVKHFCHDGSLYNGSECVFHPATFMYLKSIKPQFKKAFEEIKSYLSIWDNGRCGLHTHHTRSYYSVTDIYKLIKFYSRYKEFFYVVGGKSREYFDRYASIPTNTLSEVTGYLGGGRALWDDSHHKGINLENRKTIELRFFRGTLNFESFWNSLIFSIALMDYIKKASINNISPIDFICFIKKNKEYKGAYDLITKRTSTRKE